MSAVQLHLDGSQSPPEPVVRKGWCGCGCGGRVAGRSRFVNGAHRQRAYRARVKREMERAGLPPSPSLRVAKVARGTSERNGDAQIARNGPQTRRAKPSGLQLAYYRAVAVVAAILEPDGELPGVAVREAEEILRPALSDRQRARLEEREAA